MIRTRRLIAPVLLLLAVVAVVIVGLRSGRDGAQVITARFENVNGLIKGAPVRAGGVRIGSVERVSLGAGDVPVVTMTIDPGQGYVVREGATANLAMLSQAGQLNRYIELSHGSGRPLGRADTLTLAQTDQPVQLDDVFATLDPATRRNAQEVVATLDRATRGRGDDVSATLDHSDRALRETSGLLADLAADGPWLRRLVRQTRTVVAELAADPEDLAGATDELAATLAVTARRQRELGITVDGLEPGLRGARRSLDELRATIPALRRAGRTAGPAAQALRDTTPDLVRLLDTAPEGLQSLETFVRTAPPRLRAVLPLLRDLQPLMVRLPRALKTFGPIVDEFRVYTPDVFSVLPLMGAILTPYDVNGHVGRAVVAMNGIPEGETGPGGSGPGQVPFPFTRAPGAKSDSPWLNFRDSFIATKPWDPTASGAEAAPTRKGRK